VRCAPIVLDALLIFLKQLPRASIHTGFMLRQEVGFMAPKAAGAALDAAWPPEIPGYLREIYWWAYVHPNAVRLFERQWLVNLILFGNFTLLRDTALGALGERLPGKTLQIACVYGDFSARLAQRVEAGGTLDIVDVLPIQLRNLRRKLPRSAPVRTFRCD
jgi:hypothetical protein